MIHSLRAFLFWILGEGRPQDIIEASDWEWYALAPTGSTGLVLLLLAAIGAAGLNLLPRAGMPWKTRASLSLLRLVGCVLLVLLFAQLEARVTVKRSLKPNLAVVTDTSGSMGLKDEGGKTRLEAAKELGARLMKELQGRAHVAEYALDWRLRPHDWRLRPDGPEAEPAGMTRLMAGLHELLRREGNLQAAVVLTDGNDTAGDQGLAVAPLLAARGLPIYPVTFGRTKTTNMPRLRITGGGEYVRLGDELHLKATISAEAFQGQVVRAQIFQEGSDRPLLPPHQGIRIGEKPVALSFVLKPDKPGRFIYRVVVDGLKGAPSEKLLAAEHAVDVIDRPIRVLYVDIPRPENKVLGHWLARDQVIDLAALMMLPKGGWYAQGQMRHKNAGTGLPDQEADLHEYDVLILGDIPRSYFREGDPSETKMQWLVEFVKRRGGGLITLGGRSVYAAGQYQDSDLADVLPFTVERTSEPQIKGRFRLSPTPLGLSHPLMQLERDFGGNRNAWFELPQLEGCNRVGEVKRGASLLAVRDLPEGPMPVMAYQNVGKGRVLGLAVDTTWRWEMQRPRGSDAEGVPEAPDYFRVFWGNAVRFLAPDPRIEPERPQIARQESHAEVGQTITLTTRLVDRVFKPIRKADLTVRVTSPSGKALRIYPSDSRSRPGVYEYSITLDEAGLWEVTATHNENEVLEAIAEAEKALKKAESKGDSVAAAQAKRALVAARARTARETIRAGESLSELEDPRAKPSAMAAFAQATGGQSFQPSQVEELIDSLKLDSHSITQRLTISLWNLPVAMILLIMIVAADCYIRKRRGMV